MNKRLGLLSLFGITALLLAMVGAITALAAPSATHGPTHVDGSYVATFPKAWYKDGNVITVRINDADRNVSTAKTATVVVGGGGMAAAGVGTKAVDLALADEPNTPVDGTPTVTVTDASDVPITAFTASHFNVQMQFADRGTFTVFNFHPTLAVGATDKLVISYKEATKQILDDLAFPGDLTKLLVRVKTTQNNTGFLVRLEETTATSGVFQGTVTLVGTGDPESSVVTDTKIRIALTGDVVTFTYTDKTPADTALTSKAITISSTVDLTKPTIANVTPADKLATQLLRPDFTATFTDAHSGVDVNTLAASLVLKTAGGGTLAAPCTITGTSVTCRPTLDLAGADSPHTWQFVASDVAGNVGQTDANAVLVGDQTYTLTHDLTPPAADFTAKTGIWWDATKTTDDKTEAAASKAKSNSIRLTYNEKLAATTVEAADYTVVGNSVTAANVYAKNETHVFLTLGNAMVSSDKPKVTQVGAVNDLAGNSRPGPIEVTPTDGIGPKVTALSVDKTLIKGDGSVVISLSTDEALIGGVPSLVQIFKAGDILNAESTVTANAVVTGTNTWTVTVTGASLGDGAVAAGQKKSVYVEVTDSTNNTGTKGSKDTASASAVTFTVDKIAPTVTFLSTNNVNFTAVVDPPTSVEGASPTIRVEFAEKVTMDKAEFGLKGAVTLADVKAAGTLSSDGKTWIYVAAGLVVDSDYSVKLSATDVAGNKLTDALASFRSKAPAQSTIPLEPGQNLISFPGDPVKSAINDVFTAAEVSAVVTYDPLNPDPKTGSPWLIATRGADGKLSGSLTKIDSKHAYFVKSSTFGSVKVDVAKLGFDATPSTLAVKGKAWNLLPVVSLEGKAPLAAGKNCIPGDINYVGASCLGADAYLGTVKWTAAYTYNPLPNAWTKLQPKSFAELEIGAGYWVYVTEDGTLVP